MSELKETVFLMKNQVQKYSWGSEDFISQLTGKPNTDGEPFAELWMGMHHKGTSSINTSNGFLSLEKYVTDDMEAVLGKTVSKQFGELPYLFKILSCNHPLSIQVHPDKKQAAAGYDDEENRLLPLNAKIRNYQDRNHKPEMLLALTDFYALTGIRSFYEIGEIICFLRLDQKIEEFSSLLVSLSRDSVRDFFNWILHLKGRQQQQVRRNIVRAAALRRGSDHPAALAIDWICRLDYFYPDDIGVFAPIMLNTIRLNPGEALYMDAGILHAYLLGSGLEIMANSDNVLRCALTPKHVDIAELLKIASFEPVEPHLIKPYMKGLEEVYPSPAKEFRLSRYKLQSSQLINTMHSAEILLVLDGRITIKPEEGGALEIRKGQSAFISLEARNYRLHGKGLVVRAHINPEYNK